MLDGLEADLLEPTRCCSGAPEALDSIRVISRSIGSPEARERWIVTRIRHDTVGWVPNVSLPIRYSKTSITDPGVATAVRQHTDCVLREWLGYDDRRIASLAEGGVFGPNALRGSKA